MFGTFFDVHHSNIFGVGVGGGNNVRSAFIQVTLHVYDICTYATCFVHADAISCLHDASHAQEMSRYRVLTCIGHVTLS